MCAIVIQQTDDMVPLRGYTPDAAFRIEKLLSDYLKANEHSKDLGVDGITL